MQRAQRRDASTSSSFFFRKDVYTTNPSTASSVASSSGGSSPVDGVPKKKEKKMGNCFPAPPRPERRTKNGPVEEEYEEMSMKEIMNGKVAFYYLSHMISLLKFV